MKLQELRSAPQLNRGRNVIDHKKRKREEKEGRKEGGAGNFNFQLASRFLSKSKPPEIHSLTQTSTINPQFFFCSYGLSKGTYVKAWIIAFIQYTWKYAYLIFGKRNRVLHLERRNPSTSMLLYALSSQLSSPGIEETVEGNGLQRLQIYEYGYLGTGNGAAGLELV